MENSETSGFPRFRDGDVSIVVSPVLVYKLHSSTLRRHSSVFARLLSTAPGARLTKKARTEGLAAYRFELVRENFDSIGRFERRQVTDGGRVQSMRQGLPDFNDNRNSDSKAHIWNWLFGCFYGKQPDFNDHDFEACLKEGIGLVDVAESAGAMESVYEVVDLALLRQDYILWRSIAMGPVAWARVGYRIHSPTIFKESVCHLIGRWHDVDKKDDLPKDIQNLCERKYNELCNAKEAIEMRILGHYPQFLCRQAVDKPTRPSYANDIYMWMTICFFRQWFAQAINDDRTRRASDGGYSFYTALSQGGQKYLNHEDYKLFHQYFPMSSKACTVLEANMSVLKEDVKRFTDDLMKHNVHVPRDDPDTPINWLTCGVVDKEDLPWYIPDPEPMAARLAADTMQLDGDLQDQRSTSPSERNDAGGPGDGKSLSLEQTNGAEVDEDRGYGADDED